jgi:hypothetical protein
VAVLFLKRSLHSRSGSETVKKSSPLTKGDPVWGISGLDPHILAFSTPKNAPTEISLGWKKKVGGKKKGHKNQHKKRFCAGPLALKPKKSRG